MTQKTDHDAEEKLGDGDGVSGGRIDYRDAQLGCRIERDVVDADAGATDDLEPCRRFENVGGDARRAPADKSVVGGNSRDQLGGGSVGTSSTSKSGSPARRATPSGSISSVTRIL